MAINVGGTENILRAIEETSSDTSLIFASSVSVYGCTAEDQPPIRIDNALSPLDLYSESKARGEKIIKGYSIPSSLLRISGIVFAGLFEFPDTLQYRADQRIEFVYLEDAASAIVSAIEKEEAHNKIFNVAGGETWQMLGATYIERVCETIGVEVGINYSREYGWFDWYDTSESQRVLSYQNTPFEIYLERLGRIFKQLLE